MGMSDLLFSISSLAVTCTRCVSRAARRMHASPSLAKLGLVKKKKAATMVRSILTRGVSTVPFFDKRRAKSADGDEESSKVGDEFDDDDGVWRRTILMGEKCQPLDFSGAIHYDCYGRQLEDCPMPRSPLRSAKVSFAYHAAEAD
uniref:Uncharacterized protein n=1 Tax=Ananas comosus var. bracteatus TaxID=296719 RepID=A0A6V7PTL3_ANACO|nr:unnamed protein product [Ananas comosus var. bracteatus]